MNIHKILSTKERIKILNQILYSEKEFGVNEIAKKSNLSKGLISKYFEILVKERILKKIKQKFSMGENSSIKAIKIMLNLIKIDPRIFKRYKFVKAVGLYGSSVKGTNTESSDIDLWIKISKASDEKIANLTSELRKKIEKIKILILDDQKIEILNKKDPLFYNSLYFSSLIIYGKENEI